MDDGIDNAGDDRARDLIHDWNVADTQITRSEPVEFDDETLRDCNPLRWSILPSRRSSRSFD